MRKDIEKELGIDLSSLFSDLKYKRINFEGFTQFLLDKELINISVQGVNADTKIECTLNDIKKIVCPFAFKNTGKDEIIVSVDKVDVVRKFSTLTEDSSFFFVPLGINETNVTFKDKPWLKTDTVQIFPSYVKGDKDHPYSKGFPQPDLPETLKYNFTSEEKEFFSSYLEIYPIEEGLLSSKYPKEMIKNFTFPSHIVNLNNTLQSRPGELGKKWGSSIIWYPRVNATPISIDREHYIQTKDFVGIRYTMDYTQAVSPADHPYYTFQGMTNDGKYFILFRYAQLYSPNLERALKEGQMKKEDLKKENLEKEIYCNPSDKMTFQAVAEEENFSPSINELDDLIKSISLSY